MVEARGNQRAERVDAGCRQRLRRQPLHRLGQLSHGQLRHLSAQGERRRLDGTRFNRSRNRANFRRTPQWPSIHAGRVWLAWDESGDNWGKDWNRDDQSRSTTLYANRHPRMAVLENGVWKQPVGDLNAAIPMRYNRFNETPRLAADASGRIWAALQIRTSTDITRVDHWANNGRWENFLTSYEGDHWTRLMPIPDTCSRPDGTFQITPGPQRNLDGVDQ